MAPVVISIGEKTMDCPSTARVTRVPDVPEPRMSTPLGMTRFCSVAAYSREKVDSGAMMTD